MARDVHTYLEELEAELAGADSALIQDALYDADEHLRAELAVLRDRQPELDEEQALAMVTETYGEPHEVAAAYLDEEQERAGPSGPPPPAGMPLAATAPTRAPVTGGAVATAVPPALGPAETSASGVASAAGEPSGSIRPQGSAAVPASLAARFFGVVTDSRTYLALVYMLIALATGIVYFTVVVTGLSLSVGLAILIVGVPFSLAFLAVVRALALVEGRLVEVLLGVRMPRRPRFGPREGGFVQRILYWLKDRRTWTAMLYMVLQLPLGVIYFTLAVTGLATGVGLVCLPVVELATGRSFTLLGDAEGVFASWLFPLPVLAGGMLFLLTLHLVRLIGKAHGSYAKAMLVRPAQQLSGPTMVAVPTSSTNTPSVNGV